MFEFRSGCGPPRGHLALDIVAVRERAQVVIGQLARRYKVPWRTSNLLGGAKVLDAQAGYESAMTMMAVPLSGANHIWRSAGWNEAGVHCSVAKFMVDCEVCAMGHRMTRGIRWDDFRARQLLADYEEPSLDAAKDEELRAYVARRSREIPAVEALNDEY